MTLNTKFSQISIYFIIEYSYSRIWGIKSLVQKLASGLITFCVAVLYLHKSVSACTTWKPVVSSDIGFLLVSPDDHESPVYGDVKILREMLKPSDGKVYH